MLRGLTVWRYWSSCAAPSGCIAEVQVAFGSNPFSGHIEGQDCTFFPHRIYRPLPLLLPLRVLLLLLDQLVLPHPRIFPGSDTSICHRRDSTIAS